MAYFYLTQFQSGIPASQGKYILEQLRKKITKGNIQTIDDFKDRLKKLTTELLEKRIKPTFVQHLFSIGQDISSEYFNDMLETLENDLSTAVDESNSLEELLSIHHNLIHRTALQVVRYGTQKLTNQLKGLEFLRQTHYGFDDILLNTFDQPQLSSVVDADIETFLEKDPRSGLLVDQGDACYLNLIGEELTSSLASEQQCVFKSVTLRGNGSSTNSELDASFANLDNIIDGKTNTFWAMPILRSQPTPGGVLVELQLDLAIPQIITYVEIEPASEAKMVLVNISIIDDNNLQSSLADPNLQLFGPALVPFKPVYARSLILRFKQENHVEIQFKKTDKNSVFYQATQGTKDVNLELEDLRTPLETAVTSSFILEQGFGLPTQTDLEEVHYWQYNFALDNIRAGFRSYQNISFFIAEKKTISKPGLLGLGSIEERPTETTSGLSYVTHRYPTMSPTEESKFYHGSIEYWVVAKFYDENDEVITTNLFPILPVGASRIYHERLVLTHRLGGNILCNDSGALMFYTAPEPGDVWVYRNRRRLAYGTDWTFVANGDSSGLTIATSGSGSRMQRGIQLLATPSLSDIFTVSYTPLVSSVAALPYSTQLLTVVDLSGDEKVRTIKDNLILIDKERLTHDVEKADFYLMVILRRNSGNIYVTPILEEFALALSSRQENKFANDYV